MLERVRSMRVPGVLFMILCAADMVAAQPFSPVTHPLTPYYFRGGSVMVPPGGDWNLQRPGAPVAIAFGRGPDFRHTWAAVVSTIEVDSTPSLDELGKVARFRAIEGHGRPMTEKRFEMSRDSSLAPLAIRYRYLLEDRKVPYDKGKLYLLDGEGILLAHPDVPNLILALEFSERAESSVPLARGAEGDSFLARFHLARITRPPLRAVEVGFHPYLVVRGTSDLWAVCSRPGKDRKSPKPWWEVLRVDPSTLENPGAGAHGRLHLGPVSDWERRVGRRPGQRRAVAAGSEHARRDRQSQKRGRSRADPGDR